MSAEIDFLAVGTLGVAVAAFIDLLEPLLGQRVFAWIVAGGALILAADGLVVWRCGTDAKDGPR